MGKTNFNQSKQSMKPIGSVSDENLIQVFDKKSNKPYRASISQILSLVPAGGGIPDIQTITSGIGDVTSSIINGETRTLYTYEAPNADLSTYTATLTGEIWEFTIPGTGDYLIFVGQGFDAATLNPLINKFYWHAEFTTGDVRFSYGTFQSSDGSITVNKLADTPNPGDITIKKIYQTYGAIENQIQSNTYVNGAPDGSIETKLEMDAQTADVFTASQIRQDGGNWHYYVPYQYVEVTINPAEILAWDVTPTTLLPQSDPYTFYDIDKIFILYENNGTPYSLANDIEIRMNGIALTEIDSYLLTSTNEYEVAMPNLGTWRDWVGNTSVPSISPDNGTNLQIGVNPAPTLGNGRLFVKIWYRVVSIQGFY